MSRHGRIGTTGEHRSTSGGREGGLTGTGTAHRVVRGFDLGRATKPAERLVRDGYRVPSGTSCRRLTWPRSRRRSSRRWRPRRAGSRRAPIPPTGWPARRWRDESYDDPDYLATCTAGCRASRASTSSPTTPASSPPWRPCSQTKTSSCTPTTFARVVGPSAQGRAHPHPSGLATGAGRGRHPDRVDPTGRHPSGAGISVLRILEGSNKGGVDAVRCIDRGLDPHRQMTTPDGSDRPLPARRRPRLPQPHRPRRAAQHHRPGSEGPVSSATSGSVTPPWCRRCVSRTGTPPYPTGPS